MYKVRASKTPYRIILSEGGKHEVFPYLRNEAGEEEMCCVSSHHGRSYIVGKTSSGRFVISKGNGLSYSQYQLLHTGEFGDDTLGLLLKMDAERDFVMGQEIEALGIKTNHMEYVIELLMEITLTNGHKLNPVLLQYDVECPYRICDAAFMTQEQIQTEVKKWEQYNEWGYKKKHMIVFCMIIEYYIMRFMNKTTHGLWNYWTLNFHAPHLTLILVRMTEDMQKICFHVRFYRLMLLSIILQVCLEKR